MHMANWKLVAEFNFHGKRSWESRQESHFLDAMIQSFGVFTFLSRNKPAQAQGTSERMEGKQNVSACAVVWRGKARL
jgi:hypothetical protein